VFGRNSDNGNDCAPQRVSGRVRRMRMALSAVLMCMVLGACAQGGGTPPVEAAGSSVTSPAAEPSPTSPNPSPVNPGPTGTENPPAPTPPGKTGTGPGKPAGPTTMTGTITAGVEPNCLLMDGYLLVGGDRTMLRSGARVTVTGRVQTDLMTTCQQGTPFIVESAQAA
jgi:hypothetical protein